jgi:hypothetical protein
MNPRGDPSPGRYRHYKGGLYTLLFVAPDTTNGREDRKIAVYVTHQDGVIRARDLAEFEAKWTLAPAPDDVECARDFVIVAAEALDANRHGPPERAGGWWQCLEVLADAVRALRIAREKAGIP